VISGLGRGAFCVLGVQGASAGPGLGRLFWVGRVGRCGG
jgi:hypothetical protein